MNKPGKGRGIQVTHKATRPRPTNEYYRLARLARATAWQRVYGEPIIPPTGNNHE